jgi:hypothetical protein
MHHKLYSSHEQFPIAVFQFLTHVESEGYRCHELYCDTFSVNISTEIEEVLGLFQVKLVPVSAGTPQEVSFVETAHRVVAARSRAMLLGAPHLPKWCWALADKHAVYVGRLLPQSTRGWKSAYFLNRKIAPNWRNMSVHVFGAPCAYAPMEGPVHKRASRTAEGYFVGVQHPMVLILRKEDMKLISCSRKKVMVYESSYTCPLALTSSQLAVETAKDEDEILADRSADEDMTTERETVKTKGGLQLPPHVQSIKSVSAHTIPLPNTIGVQNLRAPTRLDDGAEQQSTNLGEGLVVPEHKEYEGDLQNSLRKLKERAGQEIVDPGIRQKVLSSLKKANDYIMRVAEKGWLKVGKKIDNSNVNAANIVKDKRIRRNTIRIGEIKEVIKYGDEKEVKSTKKKAKGANKSVYQVGDIISADPRLFDATPGSFSKENPERQIGEVVKVFGVNKIIQIKWLDKSKLI